MVTARVQMFFSDGLRHLMSAAPWTAHRLKPFAGCAISLNLGEWVIPFTVDPDGFPVLSATPPGQADLSIQIPLNALPLFLTDRASALRQIHLEGNSGLATEIGFLAKNFRPDLEELLSRVVGDILAHRMAQTARSAQAWARDSLRRLSESAAEYATEEAQLIASRTSLHFFASEVERLAQDVQLLEQRMARRP